MKFLNSFKRKTLWSSLLPVFIALYLLFSLVSISVSQIFLSFTLICWIILLIKEKKKFSFPVFFWPLLAYVALSLISTAFSVDPKVSLKDSKELLLFIIVPIIYTGFSKVNILKKANLALLVSAYAACIYSFFYYVFKARPWERVAGFMGQPMTQAGLLLLFSCMALSIFLFSRDKIRFFWGLGLILSLTALTLAQVKNAWIGLIIASCLILFFYKPKTLFFVPIVAALLYLGSPKSMKTRLIRSMSPKSQSIQLRIEYIKAGIKIIGDYPLLGTGPDTVDVVYQDSKYGLSEEAKSNVHLHNNILQTAAERGIFTLIAWLIFMALAFISLLNLLKNKDPTICFFTVAALAAILGLFTAGLFEYNFADSEITALFLYIITIPFTLARIKDKETPVNV